MSEAQGPETDDPVAAAAQRLERAVVHIGARLDELTRQLEEARGDVEAARDTDADRARLAAALDAARAREAELGEAAQEAAEALDSAIADLHIVLGEDAPTGGDEPAP